MLNTNTTATVTTDATATARLATARARAAAHVASAADAAERAATDATRRAGRLAAMKASPAAKPAKRTVATVMAMITAPVVAAPLPIVAPPPAPKAKGTAAKRAAAPAATLAPLVKSTPIYFDCETCAAVAGRVCRDTAGVVVEYHAARAALCPTYVAPTDEECEDYAITAEDYLPIEAPAADAAPAPVGTLPAPTPAQIKASAGPFADTVITPQGHTVITRTVPSRRDRAMTI